MLGPLVGVPVAQLEAASRICVPTGWNSGSYCGSGDNNFGFGGCYCNWSDNFGLGLGDSCPTGRLCNGFGGCLNRYYFGGRVASNGFDDYFGGCCFDDRSGRSAGGWRSRTD